MADTFNVLIAMDESEHAKFAFDYYMKEIHQPDFNIIIVHVVALHDSLHKTEWYKAHRGHDADLLRKVIDQEKDMLKEKLDKLTQMLKDAGVEGSVKSVHAEQPGRGIVEAAEEFHVQMIILGCRGMGKVRRTLMGSVSDFVVHHATMPTLVCRHPHKHEHHGLFHGHHGLFHHSHHK